MDIESCNFTIIIIGVIPFIIYYEIIIFHKRMKIKELTETIKNYREEITTTAEIWVKHIWIREKYHDMFQRAMKLLKK